MLKILVWILLFYLVIKLLRNVFAPPANRQPQQFRDQAPPNEYRKPGETYIKHVPDETAERRKENKDDDEGEYIDYKELK